jgi:hypothetical protein
MGKTKEELLTLFGEILEKDGLLKAVGIHEVNHKPHPFTVGPKHVKEASDHNGGVLSEEICEKIQCAHKGCQLPYSEHESDKTLFLQLTRDVKNSEANEQLVKIKESLLENNVDGIAFVDSEEKYRFIPDEEEN